MARLMFALLAMALAVAGPAGAQALNGQQQAEVRALVRDYLVNNPSVLEEALDKLQERKTAERVHRAENDSRDFSIGPANAPITVVEMFDYRCPFCMTALPWMLEAVATRRNIRFVFKEVPLPMHYSQGALEASRASMAAMPQGRYLQFHRALMNFRGDLTGERIDQLARQSGIDVARMRRNMNNANITALLQDNQGLASDLGGAEGFGTPTFLINGRVVVGFRDSSEVEAALQEAARNPRGVQRASR